MSVLTRLSLKYRILIGLLTAAIAGVGLYSTTQLNQELMPSIELPQAFVSASLDGASPDVMVAEVTEPIEQAVRAVPDVEQVTSTTYAGVASISVSWRFGADRGDVETALKAAVESTEATRPEASNAELVTFSIDALPVLTLGVSSSEADAATLTRTLEDTVIPALNKVDGVQQASVAGIADERVEIRLRQADVDALGVEPSTIQQSLETEGLVLPAGDVQSGSGKISVQVGTRLGDLEALRSLPFQGKDATVTLGQFADVALAPVPAETISRVNGAEALTISVTKVSEASTVSVVHDVQAELERLAPQLGAGIAFTEISNQAPFIEQSIHDLTVEGGLGLIFAVIVIFVFLASFRSTIVAAVSIPMSLLVTMVGLSLGGYSLNILTLGALTIAVGRVVDDSIVVIENIRRRQGKGELTFEGIVASVGQVAGAITASTLTTVAVFLPMAFVSGIPGQLFRPFSVTVTIALLASLVVALTIVPVFAYWILRAPSKPESRAKSIRARAANAAWLAKQEERNAPRRAAALAKLEEKNARRAERGRPPLPLPAGLSGPVLADGDGEESSPYDAMQRFFVPILDATLRHPRRTIAGALILLVLTGVAAAGLRSDFLGSTGEEQIVVEQSLEEGSTLEQNLAGAQKLEEVLGANDGVDTYLTSVGETENAGSRTTATIQVVPKDGQDAATLVANLENNFAGLSDVGEVAVLTSSSSAVASDVEIAIQGEDADALRSAATQLEDAVRELPGVTGVKNDLVGEGTVVAVEVDRARAAQYGYTQATLGQAVSAALSGTQLGTVRLDGADRDIMIAPSSPGLALDQLPMLELPITATQKQNAIQDATDALTADQEEKSREQQSEAQEQMRESVDSAISARDAASAQVSELQTQLSALQNAPLGASTAAPVPDMTPEQAAQAQRDAEIAQLSEAISQAQAGIEQANEGVDAAVTAQEDAATANVEAEEMQARQEGIEDTPATPIRLADIATVAEQATPSSIARVDGARQVSVSVTPEEGRLSEVSTAVFAATDPLELPSGVSFVVGGAVAEQEESFQQLGLAMLLAIVLVFLIMVATFRSLIQPLILLVSVPFAATGAVALLLLTDTPLALPSLIGLLMLIGIVVTNAIVLIDLVNHIKERGGTTHDAIVHGARLRLRPILMTAAATIFALVPMALGITGGGVFISKPLAIVVIGGLVSSTLLTLLLVPVLYSSVERRRERRVAERAAKREAKDARRAIAGV